MAPPVKPEVLNGEHGAIWDFMLHLNGRIDRILWTMIGVLGTTIALLGGFIMEIMRS